MFALINSYIKGGGGGTEMEKSQIIYTLTLGTKNIVRDLQAFKVRLLFFAIFTVSFKNAHNMHIQFIASSIQCTGN